MTRFKGMNAADIGGAPATTEALTIAVDYVGSAFDPPVGTVFTTQQQIDRMLATAGETAFKHLQAVIDALPENILHNPTINCALGVHRPQVGFTSPNFGSWEFRGFNYLQHTAIVINGSSPATWPALPSLGGLTVTGQQTGSGDPWIDVSGTPFVAGDLKGRYAVTDAGQVLLIQANTTSRIFVANEISPVPTTVTITEYAGSVFRNAQTDVTGAAQNFYAMVVTDGQVYLNDVTLDAWGSPAGTTLGLFGPYPFGNVLSHDNLMLDRRTYFDTTGSFDQQQAPLVVQPDSAERDFIVFRNLSLITVATHANEETKFLAFLTGGFITIVGSFWGLGRWGLLLGNQARDVSAAISISNSVWDDCLDAANDSGNEGMLQILAGSFVQLGHIAASGKINEIRNTQLQPSDTGCIALRNGGFLGIDQGTANQQCTFTDNAADLIRIVERGTLLPVAYTDGGGNTGVGIKIVGPDALVRIGSDMTATGSGGDIEIAGATMTYAEALANSPIVELGGLNRLEKFA